MALLSDAQIEQHLHGSEWRRDGADKHETEEGRSTASEDHGATGWEEALSVA